MKKTMLGLTVLCLWSLTASIYAADFCGDRSEPSFAQERLKVVENQLSFLNAGGLANGGVCWWHSRFTRNASLVARFRPDLPRPSLGQARKLIHAIRLGKSIVDVPGYSDLETFSVDFQQAIQTKLEEWQAADGFWRGAWQTGLEGTTRVPAAKLSSMMDQLYARVRAKQVVYQKLQLPGIVSHAWLVLGMTKEVDGYTLFVHDSNYHGVRAHRYRLGMTNLLYGSDPFVPYTEQTEELSALENVVRAFCTR